MYGRQADELLEMLDFVFRKAMETNVPETHKQRF